MIEAGIVGILFITMLIFANRIAPAAGKQADAQIDQQNYAGCALTSLGVGISAILLIVLSLVAIVLINQ
jgi:hypothetical protein